MSIIGSNILAGASGNQGYNLNNSLRFRSSASARLSRTFGTTGTNNKIQTFSAWVKRGLLSSSTTYRLMGCYDGSSSNSTEINFANDSLKVEFGGAANNALIATQVFRDPSAWYHVVIAIDTTQATSSNRVKMYVNGTQVTAFSTANYPAQNAASQLTSANANNSIGAGWSGFEYFDGYMTEINFIDGQALTPSSFGNTNSTTGVWQPAKYTGTYGTNGFYLNFNSIALTSGSNTGLGKDNSGNGNYWNTNNISVTAGVTYDAMLDVPTLTSATVANYAVMNPVGIIKTTSASLATFAGANLNVSGGAAWFYAYSSIAIPIGSGKYYAEFTINTSGGSDYIAVGINPVVGSFGATAHSSSEGGVWYSNNATKWLGSTNSSYGASYTANDIIGVAVDSDASTITFYKNNTSQTSISFNSNLTSNTFALLGVDMYSSSISANFGQRPFSYTPPTGFVALNTYNLPTPTILQGNKYMDATLYTGTGASLAVTNTAGFKPDFVWGKDRGQAQGHLIFDSVRGTSNFLQSNNTGAEGNNTATLTAFNSNGFQLGSNATLNQSAQSFVAWQWQAGQGSTSSNTSGSITSTVSVNATAGFSVVTYTGNATGGATVGHGLGVAPKLIFVKSRSNAYNWCVYAPAANSGNGQNGGFYLNLTDAWTSDSGFWNNTTAGSSTFTLGSGFAVNGTGVTFVAYCWAEIAGFSKFGSYTGNGSADGPFIYLGFRPKYVIIKCTNDISHWTIEDTAENPYNVAVNSLYSDTSAAQNTTVMSLDFLSNGFKCRNVLANESNVNGYTYIYAAFAENPFKNSNAR